MTTLSLTLERNPVFEWRKCSYRERRNKLEQAESFSISSLKIFLDSSTTNKCKRRNPGSPKKFNKLTLCVYNLKYLMKNENYQITIRSVNVIFSPMANENLVALFSTFLRTSSLRFNAIKFNFFYFIATNLNACKVPPLASSILRTAKQRFVQRLHHEFERPVVQSNETFDVWVLAVVLVVSFFFTTSKEN